MNYIPNRDVEMAGPGAPPDKETRDRARAMAEPLTPKSERPRKSYGSLEMSLQTSPGLCQKTSKCILKDGHAVSCWPGD